MGLSFLSASEFKRLNAHPLDARFAGEFQKHRMSLRDFAQTGRFACLVVLGARDVKAGKELTVVLVCP